LLTFLVAGDFTGLFYAEKISPQTEEIAEVARETEANELESLVSSKEEVSTVASPILPTLLVEEGDTTPKVNRVPETEEAMPPEPSQPSTEDRRIARMVEGTASGGEEDSSPTNPELMLSTEEPSGSQEAEFVPDTQEAPPVASPSIVPNLGEGEPLLRKAYPWLRPLEIAFTALAVVLGGVTLLVWRRSWAFSTAKRNYPRRKTKNYFM